jgi:hypothetical protein
MQQPAASAPLRNNEQRRLSVRCMRAGPPTSPYRTVVRAPSLPAAANVLRRGMSVRTSVLVAIGAAVGAHGVIVGAIYLASPTLDPTTPSPVVEPAAATASPLPPAPDVAVVARNGTLDAWNFSYVPLSQEHLRSCSGTAGAPAVFDDVPGPVIGLSIAEERERDRSLLEYLFVSCAADAGAEGAHLRVTVNRLASGGVTTQIVPLNDAAEDGDLACCVKAAQVWVARNVPPGETRRYRIDARDGLAFIPDPFGR